jgi:hypothetical protein
MGLIIGLLVVWAVLAILGVAIKGLIWLLWVGIILFIVTVVFGAITRSIRGRS